MSFSQPVGPRQLRPSRRSRTTPRQLWIPPEQRCRKGTKAQKRPLRQKRSPPAASVDPTGAAVPEGDESAEKAALAEKKSSRSKRGSRCEGWESVLTADYRINATSLDISFDYSDMD